MCKADYVRVGGARGARGSRVSLDGLEFRLRCSATAVIVRNSSSTRIGGSVPFGVNLNVFEGCHVSCY